MLSSMQPYSPHWSVVQARQQQVHECVLQNQLLGLTFEGAASKDGWRSQQRRQQQRGDWSVDQPRGMCEWMCRECNWQLQAKCRHKLP